MTTDHTEREQSPVAGSQECYTDAGPVCSITHISAVCSLTQMSVHADTFPSITHLPIEDRLAGYQGYISPADKEAYRK